MGCSICFLRKSIKILLANISPTQSSPSKRPLIGKILQDCQTQKSARFKSFKLCLSMLDETLPLPMNIAQIPEGLEAPWEAFLASIVVSLAIEVKDATRETFSLYLPVREAVPWSLFPWAATPPLLGPSSPPLCSYQSHAMEPWFLINTKIRLPTQRLCLTSPFVVTMIKRPYTWKNPYDNERIGRPPQDTCNKFSV